MCVTDLAIVERATCTLNLFAFNGSWKALFAVGHSGCYDQADDCSFGEQLKLFGSSDGDNFVEAVDTILVYVRSPVLSNNKKGKLSVSL